MFVCLIVDSRVVRKVVFRVDEIRVFWVFFEGV